MPFITPQDIVSFSLRAAGILGVGQSALAEDYADAFSALNAMMAQWNARRWLVYHLVDASVVSTGAQSYSVGPGGDINVDMRPDRVEYAFFRQIVSTQPNFIDYPLSIIYSREEYNTIALKGLGTFPTSLFYDSAYPLGYAYPWPIPSPDQYEVHLSLKAILPRFLNYYQTINLPDEYHEAIWSNLSIRLAAIYPGSLVSDDLRGLASSALETLRVSNAQIPPLQMPVGLKRPSLFNIFSGLPY